MTVNNPETAVRSWLIRLGKYGEMEGKALETGELVTGFSLGDLTNAKSKDAVLQLLSQAEPDSKPATLANRAAQINQFVNSIQDGDLAVVPLKTTGQIAIGRLSGKSFQSGGGFLSRKIKWLRTDLPRQAVKQDLLFSLGAVQTVCEISRNDAVNRFLAAAKSGIDPGFGQSLAKPKSELFDGGADAEDSLVDLAQTARDQIEKHISSNFTGHGLTELVADILRAQGYQARVSPPGADKGVDIVAGQGALGFEGPRLVVQVKSGDVIVDQPTLQGLIGCISDTHAEHGLLVCWAGYKSTVRQRVNDLFFRVRLWDRQDVIDALFANYDKLSDERKASLPLRRIWTLVPEEGS